MNNLEQLTGRGLTFPIILENGRAVTETGKELIRVALKNIISWTIGNRFFLGEYGTTIVHRLEDPNDDVTRDIIEYELTQKVPLWDNRINVTDVTVQTNSDGKISIGVTAKINKTRIEDTWTYILENGVIY